MEKKPPPTPPKPEKPKDPEKRNLPDEGKVHENSMPRYPTPSAPPPPKQKT